MTEPTQTFPTVTGDDLIDGQGAPGVLDRRDRPRGGGLRAGLRGVRSVKVPSSRSVFASSFTVFAVLSLLAYAISAIDGRLAGLLPGRPLPGASAVGAVGLCALIAAAFRMARLPVTPTGDAAPYLRRQRLQLAQTVLCAAAALVCGLYWAAGRV